jgi:hypothetical protein
MYPYEHHYHIASVCIKFSSLVMPSVTSSGDMNGMLFFDIATKWWLPMKSSVFLPLLTGVSYLTMPVTSSFAGFLAPCAAPEINAAGSVTALAAVAALAAIVWERRRQRS